jgi:hypothetical protein
VKQAELSAKQENLGPGWRHIVHEGCAVRTTLAHLHPTPDLVTVNPTLCVVTNTSKKAKTAKSVPKVTVGPKQTPVTKSNKTAKKLKPKLKELAVPTHPNQSPIEQISDLLDNLPLKACVELTHRLRQSPLQVHDP